MFAAFLRWYRRYYLLFNLPVMFLITELILTRVDLVHRWPFNEKDDLVKSLGIYAAHPPAPAQRTMVLLGNSAVDRGLDPDAIERGLGDPGLRVYNFGLKGSRLDDQFALVDVLLARGIKPAYAVLGVNVYLVDDKLVVDSVYPWLERDAPYVYFHRSRIRTKLWRWVKSLAGLEKHKIAKDLVVDVPDGKTPPSAIAAFLDQYDHRGPADYPLIERIPAFVAKLSALGIPTYVVLLPMAGSGTARVAEYDAVVAALRSKSPADTLDLTHQPAVFGDDLFYDVGHTNKAGRVVLTNAIIPWLRTRLATP